MSSSKIGICNTIVPRVMSPYWPHALFNNKRNNNTRGNFQRQDQWSIFNDCQHVTIKTCRVLLVKYLFISLVYRRSHLGGELCAGRLTDMVSRRCGISCDYPNVPCARSSCRKPSNCTACRWRVASCDAPARPRSRKHESKPCR